MSAVRVIIAGEHQLIRSALRAILDTEPGMAVVAEALTGPDLVATASKYTPDVVLFDAPGGNSPQGILPQLRACVPRVKVILLTWAVDDYPELCTNFGADRCLSKMASSAALVEAVQAFKA